MTSVACGARLRASQNTPACQSSTDWTSQSWKLLAMSLVALFTSISASNLWITLHDPQVAQVISLSLTTSLCTVLLTLLFGSPLAYLLAHNKTSVNHIADTLIDLPTVIPPSVAGVALLMAFGRRGLFGPVLSVAGIMIPFATLAVIGFSGIDAELKQTAALDGAGHWQTFRYVVIPLAASALLSGIAMTWARSLGKFGATIIFSGISPAGHRPCPWQSILDRDRDEGCFDAVNPFDLFVFPFIDDRERFSPS
jgi:molybdate transport system permease protein